MQYDRKSTRFKEIRLCYTDLCVIMALALIITTWHISGNKLQKRNEILFHYAPCLCARLPPAGQLQLAARLLPAERVYDAVRPHASFCSRHAPTMIFVSVKWPAAQRTSLRKSHPLNTTFAK